MPYSNASHRSATSLSAVAAILALAQTSVASSAEDGEGLSPSDRPGLLLSPYTLPQARVQIETGPMLMLLDDEDSDIDVSLLSFPTLVRVGLTDRFELRLESGIYSILEGDGPGGDVDEKGMPDLTIGAKFNVLEQDGAVPHSSLVGSVILPVGEAPFGVDDPGFGLTYVGGWSLRESTDLSVQAGLSFLDFGDGHDVTADLGARIGQMLGDRFRVFAEAGWLKPFDDDLVDDSVFVGVGATCRVAERLRLDAWVDHNLTDETPDWIVGAGATFAIDAE